MLSISTANEVRYYLFKTDSGKYYFHEPITNKVIWDPIPNSLIFDGITYEKIDFDKLNQPVNTDVQEDKETIELNRSNRRHFKTYNSLISRSPVLLTRSHKRTLSSCERGTTTLPSYLPKSIIDDQKLPTLQEFAKTFFRKAKKTSYDESQSSIPLLNIQDSKIVKRASKIFSFILKYMNGEKLQVSTLTNIVKEQPILYDEAYVQLIRQTKGAKSREAVYRGWELILVMCSLFLPSAEVQKVVRSFLSTNSFDNNKSIAGVSKLSYIRFIAMCDAKSSFFLKEVTDDFINSIPSNKNKFPFYFGISMNEIFYGYSIESNNSQVPEFLKKVSNAILKKSADKAEGIFQSINKKELTDLAREIEKGNESLYETASILQLGALLKYFISELPQPLVPISVLQGHKPEEYLKILDEIPEYNKNTLGYLIGFISHYCKKTNKSPEGYIIIFGYSIFKVDNLNKDKAIEETKIFKPFMQKFTSEWDVSFIYNEN